MGKVYVISYALQDRFVVTELFLFKLSKMIKKYSDKDYNCNYQEIMDKLPKDCLNNRTVEYRELTEKDTFFKLDISCSDIIIFEWIDSLAGEKDFYFDKLSHANRRDFLGTILSNEYDGAREGIKQMYDEVFYKTFTVGKKDFEKINEFIKQNNIKIYS